jgi:hypothetical protein
MQTMQRSLVAFERLSMSEKLSAFGVTRRQIGVFPAVPLIALAARDGAARVAVAADVTSFTPGGEPGRRL